MDIRSLFTPFPTLPTQRLTLRAFRQTDLQDLYDYASDPEIDSYQVWRGEPRDLQMYAVTALEYSTM